MVLDEVFTHRTLAAYCRSDGAKRMCAKRVRLHLCGCVNQTMATAEAAKASV